MNSGKAVFEEASSLYAAGEVECALTILNQALDKLPEDGRLWELAGILHRTKGEFESAQFALEMATTFVPLQSAGQCALADCYARQSKHDLALFMYRRMCIHPSTPAEQLLRVATGLEEMDELAMAVVACRVAIKRSPDFADGYYALGYYLQKTGAPMHIVESMNRRAIALAPERVDYRIGLSGLIAKKGDLQRAYELVAEFTEEDIRKINCVCCLERICEMYVQKGDERRQRMCQKQISIVQDASEADE